MILVDRALEARAREKRPIRVGMIGAGFMGGAVAYQIINRVPGLRLCGIANRTVSKARNVLRRAGVEEIREVDTAERVDRAIKAGITAITEDPLALTRAAGIDVILEVTGTVEFAARAVADAIDQGKHVVLVNAELDGTIGPILQSRAAQAGVVLTNSDGDQPGVQLNLHRFVKSIGLTPLVCGNIKGLQDRYRTPETQRAFAAKWGQNPSMVTSFADGTKISFEQAIVANATGMRVPQRGCFGRPFTGHVDDLTTHYDIDELRTWGGIVDFVVGAQPNPGVYVLAAEDDPIQRHFLELYKLGTGPLYSFYTPYHLCHFEVPFSVARAAVFHDAVMAPLGAPMVEVIATAKRDLDAGETLDGIGQFMLYGQCENADVVAYQHLLPIGLAEGCRLRRRVAKDEVLTVGDVLRPSGRLCDKLRAEQDAKFGSSHLPMLVGRT